MSDESDRSDDPTSAVFGSTEIGRVPVVGIGASAEGLEALKQLLEATPTNTGMAFVLVSHLAPEHASAMAPILQRATRMPVVEATDGVSVEPDHVYVIPPGQLLSISDGVLELAPRNAKAHRVVDHFLESLADDLRDRAIGVVLSGTAPDGTQGLESIKAVGGVTFAQDASAQYDGMPRSAIDSGCVDYVLPPDAIAREIAMLALRRDTPANADADVLDPSLDEFVVRLPKLPGVGAAPRPDTASSVSTPARKILVVDDNRDGAESLARVLELSGQRTRVAADGLSALREAETFRPDVVLLDIGLPKLNGFEVARRIRQEPWGQSLIIIAVTGWGQEEHRRESSDAGFDAHLVKPVDPVKLVRLVASLTNND